MGWSGGSEVASSLIRAIKKNVDSDDVKSKLYEELLEALENQDWDNQEDAEGVDPVFDAVLKAKYPDWYTEEE